MAKFIIFITEISLVIAACIGAIIYFNMPVFIGSAFGVLCSLGIIQQEAKSKETFIDDYYNMEVSNKNILINIIVNLLCAGVIIKYYNHYWLVDFSIGWAIIYIVRMGFYFVARLTYKQFS